MPYPSVGGKESTWLGNSSVQSSEDNVVYPLARGCDARLVSMANESEFAVKAPLRGMLLSV